MAFLSKLYRVPKLKHTRSIDADLIRPTLKQFLTDYDYMDGPKFGKKLLVKEINISNNLNYFLVDSEFNYILLEEG